MKLKKFTPDNTFAARSSRDTVPVLKLKESGLITFNEHAISKMGIKAGDEVVFVQDEENPKDWYISKQKGGWKLREIKSAKLLGVQSSGLVREIYASVEIKPGKALVKMLIAGTATKVEKDIYWGLLANSAKWAGKK